MLLEAERCAIRGWYSICDLTHGRDGALEPGGGIASGLQGGVCFGISLILGGLFFGHPAVGGREGGGAVVAAGGPDGAATVGIRVADDGGVADANTDWTMFFSPETAAAISPWVKPNASFSTNTARHS